MSEVFNYSVGDTIFLELYVQSNTGEGKEGVQPTVSIRNLETDYYLDFNTNIFSFGSGSNGDSKKPYLTDFCNGLYRKVWNSSTAVTASMKLAAEYEISLGSFKGKDFDYLFFSSFETDISIIKQIECGRWKIIDNQMIFYGEDETTPLLVFDLKDNLGSPSMTNVFERVKVSGSI